MKDMKKNSSFIIKGLQMVLLNILGLVTITSCSTSEIDEEVQAVQKKESVNEAARESAAFYDNLVLRWAPVHHQDVDNAGCGSMNGRGDYITKINFDNDWNSSNNWNNIEPNRGYQPTAHCYYSVVETHTHFFIIYAFFHPRDWTNICFFGIDYHENDLEGQLSIIKKSTANNGYGEFQGMVTVAHSDFYSFIPSGSPLQANQESIDGSVSYENYNNELHPVTAQESKGHGLKAWPAYKIIGDGIKYYPSLTTAEVPSNNDDRNVKYKLVNIFEANGFWERRFNTAFLNNAKSFPSTQGSGNANTPWNWDDKDDAPGAGELATNPAQLVNNYFKNLGNFSMTYTLNPYIGIN
ncbi:MAG: hypothetical protein CMP76_06770 [Flavobacterium sp.]|uniref:hypothetical protein n=1 Tax=Flavobacterium sp. TaxID=239 RepID=UPI000C5AE5F3|nr:hypothetical protein [Flavobacterium sp.]MBF02983.1 hypothetical protein [Flavobacterium sp.]